MRGFVVLFVVLGIAQALLAAEVTEVADSFDKNNPFDFNLNIYYRNTHEFANLKREYNTIPKTYEDDNGQLYYTTESRRVETLEYKGNPEMRYLRELLIASEIGLYHDLSISVDVPIVLKDAYRLLLENYDLDAQGNAVPREYSLIEQDLFPDAGNLSYAHGIGVGDIGVGIQWAPFNQERGEDAFSWLLGFKAFFPTSSVKSPKGMNTIDNTGAVTTADTSDKGVGSGLFAFDIRTAVAKRYEVAEPYVQAIAHLTVPSANSLIVKPRHEFTLNTGTDLIAFENLDKGHKIFFRLDLGLSYTTRGNNYNYITDARWIYDDIDPTIAKYGWVLPATEDKYYHILPMEDPYFTATFLFKMNFRVAQYVQFGGYASAGYRHKHYLSAARNDGTTQEPGFIPGIDSEETPWVGNSAPDQRSGGRILAEANVLVGWGFYLSGRF